MTETKRIKPVPEGKKKLVEEVAKKIKESRTVLIASTKGLPASQFQKIKKNLRGKAEIVVAKKTIIARAIGSVEKGALQNLKKELTADMVLIFSEMDSFELAGLLIDSQTPSKAKAGDIAPENIDIEPGPTDLIPGPAISELGSVGLKVVVENGKLAIKQGATIVKEGEVINAKVASVLGKLGVSPMKVGFIPLVAYDAESDVIYRDIKIDKEGTLQELKTAINKALGFAIKIGYTTKENIRHFISKAAVEEKALEKILNDKSSAPQSEEKKEESPVEEEQEESKLAEEKKDE